MYWVQLKEPRKCILEHFFFESQAVGLTNFSVKSGEFSIQQSAGILTLEPADLNNP